MILCGKSNRIIMLARKVSIWMIWTRYSGTTGEEQLVMASRPCCLNSWRLLIKFQLIWTDNPKIMKIIST